MNSSIRRRLLAERTLTLKSAIDLAKTLESAQAETKLINTEIKAENAFTIKQKSRRCYRENTCPFNEYVWSTCKMKDHLCKACRKGSGRDFSRIQMVTPRNRNTQK